MEFAIQVGGGQVQRDTSGIEAIVEDLEIKKTVLRELEPHVADSCVIATNTSTLSVSAMQEVLARPERMAGFHFFNPVDRRPTDDPIEFWAHTIQNRVGYVLVIVAIVLLSWVRAERREKLLD